MFLDFDSIIALINFLVGAVILILSAIAWRRLRGGSLAWVSGIFLMGGVLFVIHAVIEVLNWGEEMYAVSALITTLLMGGCLVAIDFTLRAMGVTDES